MYFWPFHHALAALLPLALGEAVLSSVVTVSILKNKRKENAQGPILEVTH